MRIEKSSHAAFNADNEAIAYGGNGLHSSSGSRSEESSQGDLKNTIQNQDNTVGKTWVPFELFKKGNKVRVAHNHKSDCHYNFCRQEDRFLCTLKEQKDRFLVGKFAKVHRVHESSQISLKMQMLTLYFDYDDSYDDFFATDCINYSLLGDQVANKLYEETKDREFQWTYILERKDSILNIQLFENMELIELNEKHEIETTAKIFQNQIHAFHHRMIENQLELNRILRSTTHSAIGFAKKNAVIMDQLD